MYQPPTPEHLLKQVATALVTRGVQIEAIQFHPVNPVTLPNGLKSPVSLNLPALCYDDKCNELIFDGFDLLTRKHCIQMPDTIFIMYKSTLDDEDFTSFNSPAMRIKNLKNLDRVKTILIDDIPNDRTLNAVQAIRSANGQIYEAFAIVDWKIPSGSEPSDEEKKWAGEIPYAQGKKLDFPCISDSIFLFPFPDLADIGRKYGMYGERFESIINDWTLMDPRKWDEVWRRNHLVLAERIA